MELSFIFTLLWRLQVWLSEDAFGGPKPIKLSWLVNAHKGAALPVALLLMLLYRHSSPSAWVYAGLHGSYGLCWLLKAAAFPDVSFERPVTWASGLVFVPATMMLYYIFPWLLASGLGGGVELPTICFCILLHNVGLCIMMTADCQKFFVLQAKGRHLVTDGMFARVRHPNYLGEMLLYTSYAILANHWLAWAVVLTFWSLLFSTRIAYKEASMSRYEEWVDYSKATGALLPPVASTSKADRSHDDSAAGEKDSPSEETMSALEERNVPLGPKAGVKHIAVIMDGNRRFGKRELGDRLRGHQAGGEALGRFIDACMAEELEVLTVYAFSTENWNRSQREVEVLMEVLIAHSEEMRTKALAKRIRVRVCSSQPERLPSAVRDTLQRLEEDTAHNDSDNPPAFQVNVCVSYGARDELAKAAKSIAQGAAKKDIKPEDVTEDLLGSYLTTHGTPDPEVLVRTSGEMRLSNFLLYQCAYSELVFIDKLWPDVTQEDLRKVLLEYMHRQRRFGK
mmetsp:Transcript_10722/g.24440  ORF Transcript_10722/g.24440 Transcript_10722/m.24440 type:complete len:509 (-) Transcript_10722:160-1686(-)